MACEHSVTGIDDQQERRELCWHCQELNDSPIHSTIRERQESSVMKRSRRLIFIVSVEWEGWACKGCEWHRRLPDDPTERVSLAKHVEAEFDAHDCENYKRPIVGCAAA